MSQHKKDIRTITKTLSIVSPIAIVLYGSYSRNEGSFFVNRFGDLIPYNDYDILLVVNKKLPAKEIISLKNKLMEKIQIRWIDLSQKTIRELRKLKPSIFNYDLKYAGKVLYGEKNILDQIPQINASTLSLEEGNILFKTRMWTFLGSLDENGFKQDLVGDSSRFFRNQMAKAVLSIVDVCLLQKGAYHYSYKQRVSSFKKLYSHKKELCTLSEWALSEKIKPKAPFMENSEVKKLYEKVHKYYIEEMLIVLSKRFHIKINKPEKLILLWKYYPITIIRRIGYLLIKRTNEFEKNIILDCVQLYLLFAFNNVKGVKYLKRANNLLQKLNKDIKIDLSWHEARLLSSKMRLP